MSDTKAERKEVDELPLPVGTRPRGAWFIVAFATALLLSGIFFLHHFSTGLYFARLRIELEERLSSIEDTNDIFSDQRFGELLSPTDKTTRTLLDLIETLEDGRIDEALKKLNAIREANDVKLSESANLEAIRNAVEKTSAQRVEANAASKSLEDSQKRIASLTDRTNEFRNKLRALLKIPIENEEAPPQDPPFYRDGMLATLPVIPGIPDELADESALISYLGGSGAFPGGKLPDDVRAEVSHLRNDVGPVAAEMLLAERQRSDLEARRTAAQSRSEDLQRAALVIARHGLLSLLRADISASTRSVYELSKALLRRFDLELPSLP